MGGCCCCCSSRRFEPIPAPTYYYCPRISEERQPLSAHHGGVTGVPSGLIVDTNLDTSNLDTYTPPPPPMPYTVDFGHQQIPPLGSGGNYGAKSSPESEITHAAPVTEVHSSAPLVTPEKDRKEIDCESQTALGLTPAKDSEDDLKKPTESMVLTLEEDDCPICLEEYTEENPKMFTRCEHHFHLCCLLEWMERSDNCPVCDEEVYTDDIINN